MISLDWHCLIKGKVDSLFDHIFQLVYDLNGELTVWYLFAEISCGSELEDRKVTSQAGIVDCHIKNTKIGIDVSSWYTDAAYEVKTKR